MQKTLSIWNYFTLGFGAIIGTGWVILVGDWMVLGGGPAAAIIAFILGAIILLPIGNVFGELTAAIPIAGGIVEYVQRSMGNTLSYITGWLLILGNAVICPWEAIAISTIISDMFGDMFPILRSIKLYTIMGADVYLYPTLISLVFALFIIYLNFKGASSIAKLQSFLTKAMLTGMVLAMIISFIKGSPSNILPLFSHAESSAATTSASGFFGGIMSVLVITPFFYAGFDTIPQQAEEATENLNWNHFGKIIGIALIASGFFYCICIYSFGSIVPWTEFIKSNVPALSCLKNISMYFYLPMVVIATLGALGPFNSFYAASARIMLAMGRKGYIPESFSRINPKTGSPAVANTVLAVITIVGAFFGKKMLLPLVNVSSLSFVFACTMVSFACLKMRKTEPELPRPYKVPGGKFGIALACAGGIVIIALMVIPASPASLSKIEWIIILAWLVFGLILKMLRKAVKK